MDRTAYNNHSKAWDYIEDHALGREGNTVASARRQGASAGFPQASSAQAQLLGSLVHLTRCTSVISIGTGDLVQVAQLVESLENSGQLTAVDSSAAGIAAIRDLFQELSEGTATTLRAVNASPGEFLPRLNAGVYGMIVVSGDPLNYAPTFLQAPRLLDDQGIIVFGDVLAMDDNPDGGVVNPADRGEKTTAMRSLIEQVEADERFVSTLIPVGTGMLIAINRQVRQ